MEWILSAGAAALAGVFASMGLGGGVVLMIYLRLVAGLPQLAAQGINLAFFLPVGLVAVVIHTRSGLLSWKNVAWCVPPGLAGAVVAGLLVDRLPESLLGKAFACLLLFIGVREILATFKKEAEDS